ncbi:MAG TPA: hypothetical protein VET30_05440, partial [Pseudoxanthomonas sp.]|nr:hypothetical protein [Pseudoxanthomonas sp.]
YRRVFSEIMIRRMANPKIGTIFPAYTGYSPLGIVQGADLTPQMAAAAVAMTSPSTLAGAAQPQADAQIPPPATADWQLRGRGDRILTRRER